MGVVSGMSFSRPHLARWPGPKGAKKTLLYIFTSLPYHQSIRAASRPESLTLCYRFQEHHDSLRSGRLCQQTWCWSHPSPSARWSCTHTLQYSPHFHLPTRRRLSPKRHRKTPSVMDNKTCEPGHERGWTSGGRYRLHMLHKGARHGSPTAERCCRREDVGSALGKETGWRQPLCWAYVTS